MGDEVRSSDDFESEYAALKEQYGLPDFTALAEGFDIEKRAEKDSSFLAREIRRAIAEKLSAYLQLFEMLINPTSPPLFVFSILKNVKDEHRIEIRAMYKKLAELQVVIMRLDTVYSEKEEVEFIKKAFSQWQELKGKVLDIVDLFDGSFENGDGTRTRDYLN
jgi:hypothetical protein